jgi:hypothetical protein
MTNPCARKQARRFWGAMGAAMRRTARGLDIRNEVRTDPMIRRDNGLRAITVDARMWRGS